jgi:hypothetical protein
MKKIIGRSIATAITLLALAAVPAFAVVKNAPAPVSTPTKANSKSTALTKTECGDLGGSVSSSATCNSGSMCTTTDENGNSHHVCISARKK